MRNPFRFRPRPVAQSVKTVPKRKDVTTILPPPYEEYPQSEGAVSLPSSVRISCPVLALKRCLIWRMAIDWGLQHHISKSERPSNREYSTFEGNCGVFGALLGKRCLDPQETEKHLWTYIFEPADRMGLEKNLLEFFMFSVQRAKRLSLKRITSCRNVMLLVRLVLDSRILIDLVHPESNFARELKATCADLHKKNFSWLLDPACISLDKSVKARATDIYSKDTLNGRWRDIEMLLRECMRPCTSLMDTYPALLTMYEVDSAYFQPDADPCQQPDFSLRPRRTHKDLLPTTLVCGPVAWLNYDTNCWDKDKLEIAGRFEE